MVAPGTPGDPGIVSLRLASGSVANSTALLPGGSYSVLAHYGGGLQLRRKLLEYGAGDRVSGDERYASQSADHRCERSS